MYQGVKEFISTYKTPFDRNKKARKIARERMKEREESYTSKEGKKNLEKEIELVLAEWDRKIIWGTLAHDSLQKKGLEKYPDAIKEEYKKTTEEITSNEVLDINTLKPNSRYYEKLILDPLNQLVGRVDELYIDKKWNIHITEYKSSKNLNKTYTYMTPMGPKSEYYFHPISHIVDCNFFQAALQASFYMYMLWYYNKKLKTGTITIKHIILNEDNGEIESVVEHEAPYLLEEVKALLKHRKK